MSSCPHCLRVTYLQEFINFNLSVLVEVHLVKDLVERVFINLDVDALQRRKNKSRDRWDIMKTSVHRRETERKKHDSLPKLAGRRRWWWILCSLCQTCGNASCTCQTDEQSLTSLHLISQYLRKLRLNKQLLPSTAVFINEKHCP